MFVPLVLVAPILAVAAALVTLGSVTSQRVAEDLAAQWMFSATTQVEREVRDFLAVAVRTSDRYARRVQRSTLPVDDLASWRDRLLDDLATTPDIAAVTFATPDGRATWLLRAAGGALEHAVASDGRAVEVRLDLMEPDVPRPLRASDYDPRGRPWYQLALDRGGPAWTPAYFWYGDAGTASEVGAGYTRPIVSPGSDRLLGVLVVDVTLGALSDFLRRSPVAQHGYVFIVDEGNLLIAASDGPVTTADGRRLRPGESSSIAARSIAALPLGAIDTDVERVVFADGTVARAQLSPIRPFPGVNWRIATVVPEAVFLDDVRAAQDRSTLLAVVAAAGAVVLGLLLARHITSPILRLREHAQRIGHGELDARLQLKSAREIEELARDLNQMAAGLQEAMATKQALAIADEVQQSLLPQAPPRVEGLGIAGHAAYCDATGGDYFDFIELAPRSERRLLVAVADVMGHGVAAALLMATARAALRAAAVGSSNTGDSPDLGSLVTRVNDVLARDARHGRFVTLALCSVDPRTRRLAWASAGHDPPIVYDAAADRFIELSGGDLPLGVSEGLRYEQYLEQLPPGATIVIGTDGIWEARAPAPEAAMFGKARLREAVRAAARADGADADTVAARIREDLARFVGAERIRDDVTFVVLKLRG